MSAAELEPLSPVIVRLLASERRVRPESAIRARVMARARASSLEAGASPLRSFFREREWLLVTAVLMTALGAAALMGWGVGALLRLR